MLKALEGWKDAAPAIGAIIAALSSIVALVAFIHTRHANRRRATLDMVLKTFAEQEGDSKYNKFKEIMQRHNDPADPLDIIAFADPKAPPTPERQIIRAQLNEYELISLGIRMGIFEEKFYKMWFQNQFQRDFCSLEVFINKVREYRPSVFCEYTWLYNRWKKTPHPENSPNRFKIAWWAITNNAVKLKSYATIGKID